MRRNNSEDLRPYLPSVEWFDRWWTPPDLLEAVRGHNLTVPQVHLFNRPQLKPLLETYAAAKFATVLSQDRHVEVRMSTGPFPDFLLQVRGEVQQFELTEADHAERRRGDEYGAEAAAAAEGMPASVEYHDIDADEAAAFNAIARALANKADKTYRPAPHLLVYVNLGIFDRVPLRTIDALALSEPYRQTFASMWFLWGGNIGRFWPRPCVIRDCTQSQAA